MAASAGRFRPATLVPTPWDLSEIDILAWLAFVLLVAAAVLYLLLLRAIAGAVGMRDLNFPPSPAVLRHHWLDEPPDQVRRVVVETIADAYGQNREQLWQKSEALDRALRFLLLEAITLTAGLALG